MQFLCVWSIASFMQLHMPFFAYTYFVHMTFNLTVFSYLKYGISRGVGTVGAAGARAPTLFKEPYYKIQNWDFLAACVLARAPTVLISFLRPCICLHHRWQYKLVLNYFLKTNFIRNWICEMEFWVFILISTQEIFQVNFKKKVWFFHSIC